MHGIRGKWIIYLIQVMEYMELVRDSSAYSDEEISAIERLIISGAARYFKEVIDQVRSEQVQREIEDMLV